jgi:leader peptidase (prepilin peptidase) / N-methyltransferase
MSLRDLPTAYWVTVAALAGLAVGSFWTVLVHRWPAEQSLAHPRSHCGHCRRTLGPIDLVPVVSWAVLRGRCRTCRTRVSPVYPLTELATAALAAGAVAAYGPTWRGLAAALLGVCLVPVVLIDLRHRLIPDIVVLPAAALALLAGIAGPGRWWVPVVSALGAAGFLLALSLLYPGGMGLGDVKLALLMGAVLGAAVIPAMAIAFGAGAALGLLLLLRHGPAARRMAVPFGPFLAAGALAALWIGPEMIGWYTDRLA